MRIHFHTDSATFAGCEQMLTVLLPALAAREEIEVSLSFRYSEEYERGLRERLGAVCKTIPLRLPEVASIHSSLRSRFSGPLWRPLRGVALLGLTVFPLRQAFVVYDVLQLRRIFHGADIVHINNGGFPGAGSPNAAAIAARRSIYVVNNLAYGYTNPLRWADYPIDRLVASRVRRFVTGSNFAADCLSRVLRLEPERVSVIPNSIGPRMPDETPEETRRRLGLASSDFVVACIARLERRKGHRVLLDAIPRIRQERVVVIIEGDGPERPIVERMSRKVGARYIGSESNIWNLITAADAVVLPSLHHEDFPNIVLEAMAAGKPVVASRVGGTSEQIIEGATGLLVSPGDVAGLANAIDNLASDPTRAARLGKNGSLVFRRHFAPEIAVDRYIQLYRQILKSG